MSGTKLFTKPDCLGCANAICDECDSHSAWIDWNGGINGECPLPPICLVNVTLRNGDTGTGRADQYIWSTSDNPYDIVAYRVIRSADTPVPASKPTNPKDALGVRRVSMSVLPAGVMLEAALGMMEGAAKYGRHNYRAMGVQASVYYDATMGHLMDWWEGEDIDPDSGLSHVTKAIDSLIVLRDAMLQGRFTDNRPPRSKVFKRDFNAKAGEILDKHADKKPHHYTLNDKLEDQ